MFKTINENVTAEITEKKSKFIANIFYIESKEEADKILDELSKKYYDARHNCYAYRIFTKEGIIERSSDDGEPSGTAGAPILTMLSKNNLANILVVVTRYFGGILLGTGGLVKAYSNVSSLALDKANIVEKDIAGLYKIEIKYTDLNQFKYFAKKNEILILKEKYLTDVILDVVIKDKIKFDNTLKNEIKVNKIKFIKEIYA